MTQPNIRRGPSPLAVLFLLTAPIPLFAGWWTWSEHSRRVGVMTRGIELIGEVTEASRESYGRLGGCEVDYAFELDGYYRSVTAFSCRIMKRHPVGSRVAVRVDPKDSEGALIVGQSTWPGYWPLSLGILAFWLLYAWAIFWPPRPERRRPRKRPRP